MKTHPVKNLNSKTKGHTKNRTFLWALEEGQHFEEERSRLYAVEEGGGAAGS